MKGHTKNNIHMITFSLLVFGGLNILTFTWLDWEISALMGGPAALGTKVIYTLIGLSAIYELITHKKNCATCNQKKDAPSTPPAQPTNGM